jgi:hypothetical protein
VSPLGDRKVFCLGLSRTGTTALAATLESLGLRTIHYSLNAYIRINELAESLLAVEPPRRGRYWKWAFGREERSQNKLSFDELLDRYDAFADLPFPLLYRELSQRYPDAFFVLTTRDNDSWLKSMKWLLSDGHVLWQHGLLDDSLLTATYGTYRYHADRLLTAYHQHNRSVREHFAGSERFLELKLDKGDFDSPKLAEFLDVDPAQVPKIEKRNSQRTATPAMRWRHGLSRSCAAMHFGLTALNACLRRKTTTVHIVD